MKNKHTSIGFISILFILTLFTACKKDSTLITTTVTSSIFGRVVDESGNAVYGATALAGGKTATTDANGIFRINDATLDMHHAIVKITKAGFFDGSRTFIAAAGKINNLQIRILAKSLKGSFSASAGATVIVSPEASVTFPVNAIKNADGTLYTGSVNVYAVNIDATDANLYAKMPGDLIGIRTDNSENVLQSFGMLNVELEDGSGNKLNIKDGLEAIVSLTVPASLLAGAPATIPLWYFDTTTGLWKEEGSATLTGNKYTGNVKHFTWWNCDSPAATISLSLRLVDANGIPFTMNSLTRLTNTLNNDSRYGYTDNNGLISGMVYPNALLRLDYLDACGNLHFIQNIGPFAANTNLGNIVVNTAVPAGTYTGKVTNCVGANVTNGYVKFTIDQNEYSVPTDANGNFSFTMLNCSGATTITVTAYDITGFQQGLSQTVSFSTGTTNIGTISACGSSIQEYIQYQLDGNSITLLTAQDGVQFYQNISLSGNNSPTLPSKYITTKGNLITGTGMFPIQDIEVSDGVNGYFLINTPNDINTLIHIVTNYPVVGGFYEGTINGSFLDNSSTSHTFNCSYRLKRMI